MSSLTLSAPISGLGLPHASADDKLQRILSAALSMSGFKAYPSVAPATDPSPEPIARYWNAQHFDLDKVQLFQEASPTEQEAILTLTNRGLMEEAYWIEQAGVGYMAKMVLLAETQEERMLYGLFTADEACHLAQIRQFLPSLPHGTDDPFLTLLSALVESPDKAVMMFVLQVVLEGWGLTHYRTLAQDCQHPELRGCLQGFVQAEARHHGTGITLFNQTPLTPASQQAILEVLSQFLQMIRVGPQRVLGAIAQVKGHLCRDQQIRILEELDTLHHSGTRLKTLRSLMHTPQTHPLIQTLDHLGLFQPLPAHHCI